MPIPKSGNKLKYFRPCSIVFLLEFVGFDATKIKSVKLIGGPEVKWILTDKGLNLTPKHGEEFDLACAYHIALD